VRARPVLCEWGGERPRNGLPVFFGTMTATLVNWSGGLARRSVLP
jgi:hypothetical protein